MIIPALLTDDKDELARMMRRCADFCDYVQIDIMDAKFVPSESIKPPALKDFKPSLAYEAHLMVSDPLVWLEPFRQAKASRIIYHFEIDKDHPKIISAIKKKGLSAGLAVNPGTALAEFEYLVDKVDTVLFLSVDPGFYGSEFRAEVLDKIKQFKTRHPQKPAGIDGGVKLANIRKVKDAGVDYICVGSAILKASDPAAAYAEFKQFLNA